MLREDATRYIQEMRFMVFLFTDTEVRYMIKYQ